MMNNSARIYEDAKKCEYKEGHICDHPAEAAKWCYDCEIRDAVDGEKVQYRKLYADFPNLFRQNSLPSTESCMSYKAAISEGWLPLLRKTCEKLKAQNEANGTNIEFSQIKEKFGCLRIYLDNSDEEAYKITSEAETESATICESCGKPGKRRKGGWILTMCDSCNTEREETKRKEREWLESRKRKCSKCENMTYVKEGVPDEELVCFRCTRDESK